jgi:hypothetical protein
MAGSSPILQALVGCDVQPGDAGDSHSLSVGIDAGEDPRVEAQADRGLARGAAISLFWFGRPTFDERDDLLKQFGHVDRHAPDQLRYLGCRVVLNGTAAISSKVDWLRCQGVLGSTISPGMSEASQRDGGRPVPLVEVDWLGHRRVEYPACWQRRDDLDRLRYRLGRPSFGSQHYALPKLG